MAKLKKKAVPEEKEAKKAPVKKETKKKAEPKETSADLLVKIGEKFAEFTADANKFNEKGVAVAARRARIASSDLTHLFKTYRKLTVEETKK